MARVREGAKEVGDRGPLTDCPCVAFRFSYLKGNVISIAYFLPMSHIEFIINSYVAAQDLFRAHIILPVTKPYIAF